MATEPPLNGFLFEHAPTDSPAGAAGANRTHFISVASTECEAREVAGKSFPDRPLCLIDQGEHILREALQWQIPARQARAIWVSHRRLRQDRRYDAEAVKGSGQRLAGMAKYLVCMRNGTAFTAVESLRDEVDLPQVGDNILLRGVPCRIAAIAKTPLLQFVWHVVAEEQWFIVNR